MISLGRPLADQKAAAMVAVDTAAEAARLRYITPGAGQALEYVATETEARAYGAAVSPVAADYPYLAAEVAAQGGAVSMADVAAAVIAQADAWRPAGALIKELRRGAKIAIAAATTPAGIAAAAQVTWPTP